MTPQALETVVVAPFANERLREWPIGHFQRYIELVLRDEPARVLVVGTRAQRVRANALVRDFPATRVVNACGTMGWDDVVTTIDSAASVVTNNSGIGHLAAARGRWTLCVFAASHAWLEWMPRGPRVVVITRAVPCAPCEIADNPCPNAIACMDGLAPDVAFERFRRIRSGDHH